MAKSLTLDEFRALPADHRPEVEAARQEYIQRQAEAGRLAGLGTDLSTPEGGRPGGRALGRPCVGELLRCVVHGPEPGPEAGP